MRGLLLDKLPNTCSTLLPPASLPFLTYISLLTIVEEIEHFHGQSFYRKLSVRAPNLSGAITLKTSEQTLGQMQY
jgi:hypothetical protein